MNIGVQDGLIDPKHEEAMGNAIWLFLWCVRAQTDKGKGSFVLGGMPLTYQEISLRSGFPERKLRRWMNRLRKYRYVSVTHTNYCHMRVEVMKPKKWFPKQKRLQFGDPRPQTVNLSRPEVGNSDTKNGQLNKRYSMRMKDKTPLPPASGGRTESFLDYHGTIIAVQMGNRKRIPDNREGRMQPEYYAQWLTRNGFPARIVEDSSDGKVN